MQEVVSYPFFLCFSYRDDACLYISFSLEYSYRDLLI